MDNIATETTRQSVRQLNSRFVHKVFNGRTKEAADASSSFVRDRLREASFARSVLPPQLLRDDELDPSVHTDLPRKIVELEPDSVATFVPFMGSGKRTWFRGARGEVYFGKIESQHFHKSKFELMTYRNDIRKILTDNSVKDMADQEDLYLYETMDTIITAFPGQALAPSGGLNSNNVIEGVKNLIGRKMPMGGILCTEELYLDALKLPATSIGDRMASSHFENGLDGKTLWGYPVTTTIKNDIIPNNEMWFYSTPGYLGKFYLLQDATLFIEQRGEKIEFWSYEALGIGILNSKGFTRVRF